MSKLYRGELQDNLGNTIYPHTEAGLVFCADGETVQQKIAGTAETLDGITGVSDSTELDDSTKLATSKAVKTLKDSVNSSLGGLKFGKDGDGNVGYYGADGSLIPFKSAPKLVKYAHIEPSASAGYYTISGLTVGKKYILFLHRYNSESARPTSGCTIITTYGENSVGAYGSSGAYLVIATNTTITCPNYKYASDGFNTAANYWVFEV